MKVLKLFIGVLFLYLITFCQYAKGQITTVPGTHINNRFFNQNYTEVKRPGLSVIGFDNGGVHSKGYGLKQILNQVYTTGTNDQKELFIEIIERAHVSISYPANDPDIARENSLKFQFKALEALSSYVLELNGIDSTVSSNTYLIPIRSHHTAMSEFTSKIMEMSNNLDLFDIGDDYVHYTQTFNNIARALDLYLAIENAYEQYNWNEYNDPNSTILLTKSRETAIV